MRIGTILTHASGLLACVVLVTNAREIYDSTQQSTHQQTSTRSQNPITGPRVSKAPTKVIALVNEDVGGNYNQKHYALGDTFLQELVSRPDYEWYPTTRSIANASIKTGDIDGMLIVNQDFTERILDLNTQSPTQAVIDTVIDSSLPNVTQAQLETHFQEYLARFNQNASRMYLSTIMASFQDSKWLVDDQLAQLSSVSQALAEKSDLNLQDVPENFKQLSTLLEDLKQATDQDEKDSESQFERLKSVADTQLQKQLDVFDQLPSELMRLEQQHQEDLGQLSTQAQQLLAEKDEQYKAYISQLQATISEIESYYQALFVDVDKYIASNNEIDSKMIECLQEVDAVITNMTPKIEAVNQQASKLIQLNERLDDQLFDTKQFDDALAASVVKVPVNLDEVIKWSESKGEIPTQQAENLRLYFSAIQASQLPLGPEVLLQEDDIDSGTDEEIPEQQETVTHETEDDNQTGGGLSISGELVIEQVTATSPVDWWSMSSQVIECLTLIRDFYGSPSLNLEAFAKEFSVNAIQSNDSVATFGQQTIRDYLEDDVEITLSTLMTESEQLLSLGQEISNQMAATKALLNQVPEIDDELVNQTAASITEPAQIDTSHLDLTISSTNYSDTMQALQGALQSNRQALSTSRQTIVDRKFQKLEMSQRMSIQDAEVLVKQSEKIIDTIDNQIKLVSDQLSQQQANLSLYHQNFSDQLTYTQNGGQDNLDYLNFLARPIQLSNLEMISTSKVRASEPNVMTTSRQNEPVKEASINCKELVLVFLSSCYLIILLIRKVMHRHGKV